MDLLIPLIFIILLSVVYVATQKKTDNKLFALLTVIAVILVFCYIKMYNEYESFVSKNMAPLNYKMSKCSNLKPNDLVSIERPDNKYDGLVLGLSPKPNYSLLPSDKVAYHSPVGDAYALNPDPLISTTYPSIDGKDKSAKHMFMFAYNRSSPECCPSTFSSSRGCVCMSEAQRDYINKRGSNKSINENPDF